MAHSDPSDNLLAETNALRAMVGAPPLTMGGLALELRQRLDAAELAAEHRGRLLSEAGRALNEFVPGDGRSCRELEDLLAVLRPQYRVELIEQAGLWRATVQVEGAEGGFAIDSQRCVWTAAPEDTPEGWHVAAHWSSLRFCPKDELEERLTDVLLEAVPEFFAPKVQLHRHPDATLWLVAAGPRSPRFLLEYADGEEQWFPRCGEPGELGSFLVSLGQAAGGRLYTRVAAGVACLIASLAKAGVEYGPWAAALSQALEAAARTSLQLVSVTLPLPTDVAPEALAALKEALLGRGLLLKGGLGAEFRASHPDGQPVEGALLEHLRKQICETIEKIGWLAPLGGI